MSPVVLEMDQEVAAYTLILRSVQKRISACQTRRNLFALINCLPQDITHIILDDSISDWKISSTYYSRLTEMRLICKAWDSFICNHSSFWAPTFPDHPEQLHNITIPRSRNHPLDVYVPVGGIPPDGSTPAARKSRCDRFLSRAINEHLPIRSLAFQEYATNPAEQPLIYILLTLPAPHLETLSINMRRPINNLFSGSAPLLRHVALGRSELGSDSQALSKLRSLKLRRMRGLTMQQLIQLLAQSPELEDLLIKSQDFTPSGFAESNIDLNIPLNRLRTLKLTQMSSDLISTIVRAISIPLSADVTVRTFWNREGQPEDPNFSDLVGTVTSKLPPEDICIMYRLDHSLRIKALHWRIVTDSAVDPWGDPPTPDYYTQYFLNKLPPTTRALVTTFEFVGHETMNPILRALDAAFPSLRELSFELQQYGPGFSLSALTEDGAMRRGTCPELRNLTMVQANLDLAPMEGLAQVSEARAARGIALEEFTWKIAGVTSTSEPALALIERIKTFVANVIVEERKPNDWMWPHTGGWDSGAEWSDDGGYGGWDWTA